MAIAVLLAGILLFQLFPMGAASLSGFSSGRAPMATPAPLALRADFTFLPTLPVIGEAVSFSGTASGGTPPYNYSWDFGDGSNDTGATVTHAYASAGTFIVVLTVNDSANNVATAQQPIPVTLPLTADFAFSPNQPVIGEAVSFTASASGGTPTYTYAWNFGDGDTGSGTPASHTYASAETFTVTLTVSDSANHVATTSKPITVTLPLAADFTLSPAQPVVGQTVTFSGTASGGTPSYTYGWNFGDGGTGTGAVVTHAFSAAGAYSVTLTVSDSAGHVAIVTKSISVAAGLAADFTFDPIQPVAGETVSFSGTAAGGTPPYAFSWDFGDGGTGTGAVVTYAYGSPGTYTVTLTVSDAGSQTDTAGKSIPVTSPLAADFTFAPTDPAVGDSVSFSGTATGGTPPYAYGWNFGDGGTATGDTVNHAFASAGTFTVTLTVSDSAGHVATVMTSVSVAPGLAADFTFSPILPAIGDPVSFSGTATGGTPPYAFAWDFGDGSSDAGASVSHAFASAATYTVTLTVTDAASHVATAARLISVASVLAADFTFSPTQPVIDEAVSFSATASGGTPPYTYAWDLGDGSNEIGATVSHAYTAAGLFTVSLLVSDSEGHVAPIAKSVSVAPLLSGDFSFAPTLPLTFERIDFSAAAAGGTPPYAFSWDFGDGSTAAGATASHTYTAPGFYTVSLRVSDSFGRIVVVTKPVGVAFLLAADFTLSQVFPVIGEAVTFAAEARGANPPYTFGWNFGDGLTALGITVFHSYASAGAFFVTLAVSDSAGHSATVTKPIVVTPLLIADLIFAPTKPVIGENVTFTGMPAGATPPYAFNWTFGDGSNGTGTAVGHAYTTTGLFTVTVTISDSAGHAATASSRIPVTLPLIGNFTFSPAEPVALEEISFSANASGATPPYTFAWQFRDGDTIEGANVSHAYASARSINVTLTLSDSAGHILELVQPISVGPSLAVDLLFSATQSVAGHSFAFTANASGGAPPYTYEWSFGDGALSREAQTNHAYSDFSFSRTYQVVLKVCDSAGRCTSVSENVTVQELFPAVMIAEVALAALVVGSWVIRRRPRTEEPE